MSKVRKRNIIIFVVYCIVLSSIATVIYMSYLMQRRKFLDYEDVHQFDPSREGGHLLPNLDILVNVEKLGQRVRFITNSKGFRNDVEFSYDKPERSFRIMLLGDSYIDGMRTDQEETIGYILEELLDTQTRNEIYHDYEVMISGHNNPTNVWYYYQEHGWKYHPDLVIVGITLGNDLSSYNYKKGMLPSRQADGSIRLELAPNVRQGVLRHRDLLLPTDAYLQNVKFWELFQDKELKIRKILARMKLADEYDLPPMLAPYANSRRHIYATGFYISLGLFYRPIMPKIEKLYTDFEEVLIGIRTVVETHGSQLLVVLFPERIQVADADWELLIRYYSLDKTKFDLVYPNNRISMFCENNSIDFLDLLPAFREQMEQSDKPLYRPRGDMHFNERGQALAASIIYEKIMSTIEIPKNRVIRDE